MKKCFTLIELMIVVAVIAILVSLLAPSLSKARYKAETAMCISDKSEAYRFMLKFVQNRNGSTNIEQGNLNNPSDIPEDFFNFMTNDGKVLRHTKCIFTKPKAKSYSPGMMATRGNWFVKWGASGDLYNSGAQIDASIYNWDSEDTVLGDMVRTDGAKEKVYHKFNGKHYESAFAYADGNAKLKRAHELSVFFTNGWGNHWK